MKKKIVLLIALLFLMTSCGGSKTESPQLEKQNSMTMESTTEESVGMDTNTGGGVTGNPEGIDKLITTATVEIQTTAYDDAVKALYEMVSEGKGYFSNISGETNYYSSKGYQSSDYTVRIPKENLDAFMKGLEKDLWLVISSNMQKEDVTKKYTDSETRIVVLETKEKRLLNLLDKAENMTDIIALENALSETIAEKENLKKNLVQIDDKVSYSTVRLRLVEVDRLANQETPSTSFGERISTAISDTIYNMKEDAKNFVIFAIYGVPWLLSRVILLAIVIFIGMKIVKIVKDKRGKKILTKSEGSKDKEENQRDGTV